MKARDLLHCALVTVVSTAVDASRCPGHLLRADMDNMERIIL